MTITLIVIKAILNVMWFLMREEKPELAPWEKHWRRIENQPAAAQTTTVVQFMIRKWKNLQLRGNKADVAFTVKID